VAGGFFFFFFIVFFFPSSYLISAVSGSEPSDAEVDEAMAQLDSNSNGVIDWSEFRSYIVRQIADPSGSFKVDLVSLIGTETPISGELLTLPKANGDPKVFHFSLSRSQGTLERFATRTAVRPIERIMLGRFESCAAGALVFIEMCEKKKKKKLWGPMH
jgi:hypothetical protein